MSPFNSFSLEIGESRLDGKTKGEEAAGDARETRLADENQFPGQSVGVAGFLGVLIATRMLPFLVSLASQTNPTEETSL